MNTRSMYVKAAWASPLAALLLATIFWLWVSNYEGGGRGVRPPGVLAFYIILASASALGAVAGIVGLFGIRSRRDALMIIPGALLGVCINGFNACFCLLAYGLEGRNLGG